MKAFAVQAHDDERVGQQGVAQLIVPHVRKARLCHVEKQRCDTGDSAYC